MRFNKKWEIALAAFVGGLVVAGIAFGAYLYFSRGMVADQGGYLNKYNTKATLSVNDGKELDQIKSDLNNTDLDTTDVDGAVKDLNAIDLSGI